MSEVGPEIFDGQRSTLTRRQADLIWDRMSARYAAQASGQVTLHAHDVLVPSVFLQRDLPALRANPQVTSLRIVDPVTGDERVLERGEF
ncbi:hypothetical protein [uncultured Jatrophihabitans sp.]|uniref:hypothetical protein n=1 Tax=uncultured Jatrophihabitans sp. TaxID=1610747 RepID=UPI0035C948E5